MYARPVTKSRQDSRVEGGRRQGISPPPGGPWFYRGRPPQPPPLPPPAGATPATLDNSAESDNTEVLSEGPGRPSTCPKGAAMPASPLYTPGLCKVEYAFQYNDGKQFNIIRWIMAPGFGSVDDAGLATIAANMQTAIAPVQAFTTTDVTFIGTTAIDWTTAVGGSHSVSAGGVGTETPPTLPIQCPAEIHWTIARRYRGGKPKSYLSGIAEARQNMDSSWKTAFVTALQAAALTWLAGQSFSITASGTTFNFKPVNFSKFTGGAERPTAVLDDIVSAVVNGMISSQRRRRGSI